MIDIAIECEGIGKQYHIGQVERYRTLRDTLAQTIKSPFRRNPTETFWALRDVQFEVRRGEVIGIIGRNGAGKSTLLKILSRITRPTEGQARIHGRVGSLLEVGTGFNPELTGRENVFLNGAILGMKREEIHRKFDDIVAFAGVEQFIDTPVKRYSSGMYTRLAFAVAAHLETAIVLIDEVLAVGDAQFQKKCLGRMREIGTEGRTVLFVSHNMGAIAQLCSRSMLLDNGRITAIGETRNVIRTYMDAASAGAVLEPRSFRGPLADVLRFQFVRVNGSVNPVDLCVLPAEPLVFEFEIRAEARVPPFRTTFSIYREGSRIITLHDIETPTPIEPGEFHSRFEIPPFFLRPGDYSVGVGGQTDGGYEWLWGMEVATFQIVPEWSVGYDKLNEGLVNLPSTGSRHAGGIQEHRRSLPATR